MWDDWGILFVYNFSYWRIIFSRGVETVIDAQEQIEISFTHSISEYKF